MARWFQTGLAVLALSLASGTGRADTSDHRCLNLETASALPSIEGQDGVFYRVLADLRMRHPMEDAVMQQLAALSATLADGGTTLIYVTVPTKSQAMPQFLPPLAADYAFDVVTAQLVYGDIVDRLAAHGVLAPDILAALLAAEPGAPPFFQADFHWTSDGARLAAAAIAEVIKAQPFYDDLNRSEYRTTAQVPTAAFSTMRRTLQALCIDELPRVEALGHMTEVEAGTADGASDIFAGGEGGTQIALVGTSFSDSPLGNFAGFLSEYTGLDVVNYAVTGGNQFGAMTSYLTSRDFAENPPRFLIWENPIYNNLAQYGPDPFAELVAAVQRTCWVDLPATLSGPNTLTADLGGLVIGQDAVVLADLGENGARQAVFTLNTVSGITRTATMQRSDRMLASGRFFKPLGSIWHDDLATLAVTFDRPVTDASSLSLCLISKRDDT